MTTTTGPSADEDTRTMREIEEAAKSAFAQLADLRIKHKAAAVAII
jgi:hypothetical protein